jgi:hypothetical protein
VLNVVDEKAYLTGTRVLRVCFTATRSTAVIAFVCTFAGDLFRFLVLYVYGGVYVEADSILFNDFTPIVNRDFWARSERPDFVATVLMRSVVACFADGPARTIRHPAS